MHVGIHYTTSGAQLTLGSPHLLVLQQISILHVLCVLGAMAPALFVSAVKSKGLCWAVVSNSLLLPEVAMHCMLGLKLV